MRALRTDNHGDAADSDFTERAEIRASYRLSLVQVPPLPPYPVEFVLQRARLANLQRGLQHQLSLSERFDHRLGALRGESATTPGARLFCDGGADSGQRFDRYVPLFECPSRVGCNRFTPVHIWTLALWGITQFHLGGDTCRSPEGLERAQIADLLLKNPFFRCACIGLGGSRRNTRSLALAELRRAKRSRCGPVAAHVSKFIGERHWRQPFDFG